MSRVMKAVFSSWLGVVLASLVGLTVSGCTLVPQSQPKPDTDPAIANEVWDIISRDYVEDDKLDGIALDRGAAAGILEALDDPYSAFLGPEDYSLTITQQEGSFGGIGATVGLREDQVIVTALIPGTPAAAAGMQPGDAIVAVNGESTEGLGIQEVVLLIRGPQGTPVRVTIQRQDDPSPLELDIIRAQIDVPSVVSEMKDGMGYLRIHFFSERTDAELTPLLRDLISQKAAGLIIDVRSNPGGPVETVVDVASHFLDGGDVLHIVDNAGREVSYPVRRTSVRTELPLVILTDNFSASGSEVLSGAIQDHERGVVAGTKTFGKGSANRWYELSDGSALYLTTSRWLTPDRRLIEGEGITPDIELELEGDELVQWAIDYLRDKR